MCHHLSIVALWQRLRLDGPALSEALTDAMNAAYRPSATAMDCPYNTHPDWRDRYTRKLRVAWRVSFRLTRHQLALQDTPRIRTPIRKAA